MHIGILSFQPPKRRLTRQEYRLSEEAKKRGYQVTVFRVQRCLMTLSGEGDIGILYKNKPIPKIDVLIPRVTPCENVHVRSSVIEQFQLMGIPVLNNYREIVLAKNKLQTMQVLSHFKIPVVKTTVLQSKVYLEEALKYLQTFPIVMKTIFGSKGNGVTIVESKRAVKSTYGILSEDFASKNGILLQEYIGESQGKDIRIFIVGGKAVASMERTAGEEDFRSNVGQGGSGKAYEPSKAEIHLAIRATKAVGLEVAGVDLIQTKRGPAVMEVNANPGFEELEKVTGINVAEAMIKYAVKFAKEYVPKGI